jgi:hypothetical protein
MSGQSERQAASEAECTSCVCCTNDIRSLIVPLHVGCGWASEEGRAKRRELRRILKTHPNPRLVNPFMPLVRSAAQPSSATTYCTSFHSPSLSAALPLCCCLPKQAWLLARNC